MKGDGESAAGLNRTGIANESIEPEKGMTLDQLGNWPEFKHDSNGGGWDYTQTRQHNEVNELLTISNWANPTHDAAGNMTSMPSMQSPTTNLNLKYDAWNRLKSIGVIPVGTLSTYQYDGLGRRIVNDMVASGVKHDYYYNEDWQLLEQRRNGSANPLAQYVWHPYYIDALAVRYYDANTNGNLSEGNDGAHYYCQDANFNVTVVVNASGTVLERYAYTPYGQVSFLNPDFSPSATPLQSAIGNTHLYTGRERDQNGLQLNRHRYYASHLGRWTSRDPIGYEGSQWNLYEYTGGNPAIRTDPSGLLFGWGYGNYCGYGRKASCPPGSGAKPIDDVDAACERHDCCLSSLGRCLNPYFHWKCNTPFCKDLRDAFNSGCAQNWPGDKSNEDACRRAAWDAIAVFCLYHPPIWQRP